MIFQEPMTLAQPDVHRGQPDHGERFSCTPSMTKKEARALTIDLLGQVGIPRPGAPGGRIPVPAFGRDAPAGDDRHGALVQSDPADRRRTDHRAGCDHPGEDPGPDARPPAAVRHGPAVHHPRPGRGGRDRRRRSGHVPGENRRSAATWIRSSTRPSIPTPRRCCDPSRKFPRSARNWMPIKGMVPSPFRRPGGCPFHPRCPKAFAECRTIVPAVTRLAEGHHRAMPAVRKHRRQEDRGANPMTVPMPAASESRARPGRTLSPGSQQPEDAFPDRARDLRPGARV